MLTQIYYFSGTGNSLALAREIARKVGAPLTPIPAAVRAETIHIEARRIGIVFPVYLAQVWGVPLIVERFVRKIDNIADLSIFAVCSCGGHECVNALPALMTLAQIVNTCGGKIHASFSLRLPMNNLDYEHIPVPINKDSVDILRASKARIERICREIVQEKPAPFTQFERLFMHLMTPFFRWMQPPVLAALREKAHEPPDSPLQYHELVPLTDRSIVVDEKCGGCGICVKVCPVNNITLVEGRPAYRQRCEMCFACDEWCPAGAVHHWSRTAGVKYHHPDVTLADMIEYNEPERRTTHDRSQ